MEFTGNYNLEVTVGQTLVPIQPQMIEELTISQDIDRLVPTFTLRVKDATNILGLIMPHDKNSNKITLTISRETSADKRNTFVFNVKRRRILSNGSYEVDGLLEVPQLFTPYRYRSFSGNLKENLENMALNEFGLAQTEVSSSLDYVKTVIQPGWDNAFFLRDLKSRVEGKSGETCYFCFIKNIKGVPIFVFKSLDELFLLEGKYKFIVGATLFEDFYPVSDYRIFDNSQFRAFFNSKTSNYRYFDYLNGTPVSSNDIDIEDSPALSEFYLVDKDDETNKAVRVLGRSNDFTRKFSGKMGQSFYNSVNNSIYMWISTWGLENISQGEVVLVLFSEALSRGSLFIYQHSGLWLVKRVVHILGSSFMTNLLLVRGGVDTDIDTTLLPAKQSQK